MEEQKVPVIPDIQLEQKPLPSPFKKLDDQYALALVNRSFSFCERERQWTDNRWKANDETYAAYVVAQPWPGTKVLRSALGVGIAFEQVEGAYAAVCQALFSQPEYFSLEAEFGADTQSVRLQQAHLEYGLEASAQANGLTQDMEFKLALKDMLVYGNGGVKVEYNAKVKAPRIYRIDPRHVYLDPGTPSPSVNQGAKCLIQREHLSIREIQEYRNDQRMNLPSTGQLWTMSQSKHVTYADHGIQAKEALRGNQFTPGFSDSLPFPGDKQIEILMYYSKDRIIWILNREWVMYNEQNPYGKIPFFFSPCYIFPGRFHAQSIVDQQEGNQKYIQALINNRLDNATLQLFPPRWMQKDGAFQPAAQMWGPGSVYYAENPKDGLSVHDTPDVSKNIYQEIGWIQQAADRRTGITGMNSGIPTPSNTNRTATGVSALQSGTQLRLYSLVDNFENFIIAPAVDLAISMVRLHTPPSENLPGQMRTPQGNGNQYVNVPASSFSQGSKVRVRAASKMLSRDRLGQLYQFVAQNAFQGPVLGMLQQQGQTLDINEMMAMLMEATGVSRRFNLFRQLTPQEQQAMQQAQQAQQQAQNQGRMQEKQLDAQTRLQLMDKKNQTELQKEQMKGGPDPMEMEMEKLKFQIEQMKAQMDMQMKQKDIEFQERKMQLELAFKQSQARLDAQVAQSKAQMEQAMMGQKMQQSQIQSQMDLAHNAQTQEIERAGMQQSLQFDKDRGAIRTKLEKQKLMDRSKNRAETKKETLGKGKA